MSALPQPEAMLRARPMRSTDLGRVMAIETAIYPFPWTHGNFSDSLKAGYDAWVFQARAEPGEPIVGYAVVMWAPDEVHLLNISVAAERQRAGNGRRILEWLCLDAASRGAHSMLLEVRPSNAPALALYTSSGFERIGLRRGYYPAAEGTREDALVLRRVFDHG